MERFDAVIVGTGQPGKPLAAALDDAGWKVAVVEKGRVGGTCVVTGCTPTKTMVASARVAHLARRAGAYGVSVGEVSVDMAAVRARKRRVVDDFSEGGRRGLEERDGVELLFGTAAFTGPRELVVRMNDGGEQRLSADHVFLDTGSHTLVPDIPGLAEVPWLDNATLTELDAVPEHLLVIGGGFIGLEFAQMFLRFGARVTVVEAGERLVAREDEDVSAALRDILEEDGAEVRTSTSLQRVAPGAEGGVVASLDGPGGAAEVWGSHLLLAVGRRPNTRELGLEAAGVETDERGYIRVDPRLRTSAPGVWALGEVNGGPPFTHAAYDDYRVVRANLLEGGDATTEGRLVPYALFTDPALGRVGMTEAEARGKGLDVAVATLPMEKVARAIETGETRGFMKAVVERGSGRILGAAVLGPEGGEVASVIQVAMMAGLPYTALRDGIFSHPLFAEALNNLFARLDA